IASSHPDMPEFRFGEDDADAVVAYLRTIQD
ncbi:MAG: cytochrome c, partial [Proteobacteria bacterium]|nr:cytochrome c [Pseudomonadota bacterium]